MDVLSYDFISRVPGQREKFFKEKRCVCSWWWYLLNLPIKNISAFPKSNKINLYKFEDNPGLVIICIYLLSPCGAYMQFPTSFSELELTLSSFQMKKYRLSDSPWRSKEGRKSELCCLLAPRDVWDRSLLPSYPHASAQSPRAVKEFWTRGIVLTWFLTAKDRKSV